jgi:hypothetical protein
MPCFAHDDLVRKMERKQLDDGIGDTLVLVSAKCSVSGA